MSARETQPPERASTSPISGEQRRDDLVLPFQTNSAGAMGRLIKLGPAVNEILTRHAYPHPVARALGEALALTAMLGTTLKMRGRLTLQTSTDGPLRMLVANYDAPGGLRGYASFDDSLSASTLDDLDQGKLLGTGHMALTVDPGANLDRYQGIVALDGGSLEQAARTYFAQSEQLPTFLRLAVARQFKANDHASKTRGDTADSDSGDGRWHWRAGGLLVQHVARTGGIRPDKKADITAPEYDGVPSGDDLEDWNRTRLLAATLEDHELLDPTLTGEQLLFRLFHEEGVRVTPAHEIEAYCRCSRERVEAFVKNFNAEDIADLRETDGAVTVTCEFCNSAYRFEAGDL